MKFSIKEIMECELKIDWATHEAAKYACENWHYSKCLPVGKLVKVGVWEKGRFIGVVLFGRGANKNMLKPFGLNQDQGCELVRVALKKHITPVSRILSISLKMLKQSNKNLRMVVSYADSHQGHHGGIYQAGNWIYDNDVKLDGLIVNGKLMHRKSIYSKYGFNSVEKLKKIGINCKWATVKPKHRYLMPLDKHMRKKIMFLAKPYPKRAQNIDSDVSSYQDEKGSANLTCALQLS